MRLNLACSRAVNSLRRHNVPLTRLASRLDGRRHVVYMHDMTKNAGDAAVPQMLLDTCMCHKARMAARVVTRAYDDALRPTGLRASQVSVLAAVGARGALSIKSLADALQMDRSTLTRNLRPLEEQGYVELAPERRYRSRVLTLTRAGRAAMERALPLWEGAQRKLRSRLGQQSWPTVQAALALLVQEEQGRQS